MTSTTSLFTPPGNYTIDPTFAHRRGTSTLTVRGADGQALANTEVTVEQTKHQFLFGNIGFELMGYLNNTIHHENGVALGRGVSGDDEYFENFIDKYLAIYNQATMPFYWGRFEPAEGKPRIDEMMVAAKWFTDRGVTVKGHPLVWHTVAPKWLLGKPLDEVERLQRARIRRDVSAFEGVIDTFDAINEVVIMPVFTAEDNAITPLARQMGRVEIIRLAFEEARAANPNVKLLLNDFDLSTAYECLIEAVLEAGIPIDYLGMQSHQHQGYMGSQKAMDRLNRFSRFNIPIHFTETTLVSGDLMPEHIVDLNDWQVPSWPSTPEGEERQAQDLVDFTKVLFSHPNVHAFTYWGLGDRGMWLGAPGGLLREDGSAKPSYDAFKDLVKNQWWMQPTQMMTDASGQITVSGYKGDYQVSAGGDVAAFVVGDEPAATQVTLG